jgi:hypothetical protein
LGVEIGPPEEMLEPGDLNPRGFWELREVVELNEQILEALGGSWWSPPRRPRGWELSPTMAPFRARIAELFDRYYAGRGRWGVKDPRLTLTLPIWRAVVGDFDCIVCLRNPLEVVASGGEGIPAGADGIALWLAYTCEALRLSAGGRRTFVFYEDWFADPLAVGRRIERFLHGAHGADDQAQRRVAEVFEATLRRHHVGDMELATRPDVPVEVRALHFLVRGLAAAETAGDAARTAALQALAVSLDRHWAGDAWAR